MSAILCKYAAATTLYFPLITFGSVAFTSTASLTTADSKISKNGASFATTSNAVASVGSFGYSLTLTTGDLTCARAMIVLHHTAASPTFEDMMILIDTYGNASAQHAFDLSIANQTVTASAGTVTVSAGTITSVTGSVGGITGITFPTNFSALSISATTGAVQLQSAQVVTVGTNNDKSGYSLSQTFPTNFSSLSISATTGAVKLQPSQSVIVSDGTISTVTNSVTATVGTNNDKTGYSLAAGQLFVKKNTILNNFAFFMRDSADHVSGKTGLTVASQRAIDGAAFGNTANSATELASGWYLINLAAADLNGTVIALKFTATGADPTNIAVITQA